MLPIRSYESSSLLYVWATPGAAKERTGEFKEDADGTWYWKIYVTAKAEDGKANDAIIRCLSKKLDLPKSSFEIIFGKTDRKKRIVVGESFSTLEKIIKSVTGTLF